MGNLSIYIFIITFLKIIILIIEFWRCIPYVTSYVNDLHAMHANRPDLRTKLGWRTRSRDCAGSTRDRHHVPSGFGLLFGRTPYGWCFTIIQVNKYYLFIGVKLIHFSIWFFDKNIVIYLIHNQAMFVFFYRNIYFQIKPIYDGWNHI